MKIALIQPAFRKQEDSLEIPVALLTLAASLKKNGHRPIIIDLNVLIKIKKLNYNDSFFRRAAELILSSKSKILGFSCICNTLPSAILIAKECKRLAPEVKILLGGPDVSFESKELLYAFPEIDIIVRGEGEITLNELLFVLATDGELKKVRGLTYRASSSILENPDRPLIDSLDSLPFPNLSLLPKLSKYRTGSIEGGRGCPYKCSFCSTSQMWGRCFRLKSPKRLKRELFYMWKKFPKASVVIHHDHLLTNRRAAKAFLAKLKNKHVSWVCSSRLDALDKEVICDLKEAGCCHVFIGVETGSPRQQNRINKNLDLRQLPQLLNTLAKVGLRTTFSFIIGFPGEKEADINQTLLVILSCRLFNQNSAVQLHLLSILKGSLVYKKLKNKLPHATFHASSISPLPTNLPEEISLIKKYPQLFPSFYFVKQKHFSRDQLQKIVFLFCFLAEFFPRTTFLILVVFSISPYELAFKIIEYFKKRGLRQWTLPETPKESFEICFPFFKSFIHDKCSKIVNSYFAHEASIELASIF
ncbi:MAG: radical SAM protein [Candidatus Margulisiibacteriota bacterium]